MKDAIVDGDEKKVRLLMKAGVSLASDSPGLYPFVYSAVVNRHFDLVKLCQAEGADMQFPGLLSAAIEPRGNPGPSVEIANHILDTTDLPQEELDSGLISASANGAHQLAQRLIDLGADVNHVFDRTFFFPLESAVRVGDIEMVRLLLANGADPRRHDIREHDDLGRTVKVCTLIELAEKGSHREIVELLKAA
ncbi:MAG: hypothetical protein R3D89_00285 [Sphingomonadaceae bacterium]